jgi:hypothetical protein
VEAQHAGGGGRQDRGRIDRTASSQSCLPESLDCWIVHSHQATSPGIPERIAVVSKHS